MRRENQTIVDKSAWGKLKINKLTNYMYLCLKKALLSLLKTGYFSPPLKYNFAGKSEEIAGSSFQHCMGCEGEVKRLYSRLTRAQKRQKCKFVP